MTLGLLQKGDTKSYIEANEEGKERRRLDYMFPRPVAVIDRHLNVQFLEEVPKVAEKTSASVTTPAEVAYWLKRNNVDMAKVAEQRSLRATGRFYGNINDRKVQDVDGARLFYFDEETRTLGIRVEHTQLPDFWLEIHIPMHKLEQFVREESMSLEDSSCENKKRKEVAEVEETSASTSTD